MNVFEEAELELLATDAVAGLEDALAGRLVTDEELDRALGLEPPAPWRELS